MSSLLDQRLEGVAADLEPLGRPVMFFGAGVLHRYLDEPALLTEPLRPTEDVDALLHASIGPSPKRVMRDIEASLERNGWRPDLRAWRHPGGHRHRRASFAG